MKNIKISWKLIISFSLAVVLTLVVGIVGIYGMTSMDEASHDMYANQAMPLGDLLTAADFYQRLRVQVRNAIIYTGNAEQLKTVENEMHDRMSVFEDAMKSYETKISTENGWKLYNAVSDNYYDIFKPGILAVLEGAKQGESEEDLLELMAPTTTAANQIAVDLLELGQARLGVMKTSDETNSALGTRLLIIIIVVIAVAAVVSMALALYISNMISKPLSLLTAFMNKAGTEGDLTLSEDDVKNIEAMSVVKDEVGQCINSTTKFVGHLSEISGHLEQVADGNLSENIDLLSQNDVMGVSLNKMVNNLIATARIKRNTLRQKTNQQYLTQKR